MEEERRGGEEEEGRRRREEEEGGRTLIALERALRVEREGVDDVLLLGGPAPELRLARAGGGSVAKAYTTPRAACPVARATGDGEGAGVAALLRR